MSAIRGVCGRKQIIDDQAGIAGFLERDLDVRELPVVLSWNGKVEGLKAIAAFAQQPK